MNWLRGKSASLAVPDVDWNRLRQSIAAAATDEERKQRERELGRACADRGQSPLPEDGAGVWTEAASQASDKATATQWAGRLAGDASLAEVAIHGRFAEVRFAAARRVRDLAVLKRVAGASRERDKQVYRHCMDILRAHRQGGERAHRATEIAAALRTLLELRPVAVSRLLQIEKELAVLGTGAEKLAGCADLLAQAQARVLEETREQIALRALLAAAEALRSEILAAASSPSGLLDAWNRRYAEIARDAADTPGWLAKFPARRELAHASQRIESRLSALAREAARAAEPIPEAVPPPIPPPAPKPAQRKVDRASVERPLEELEQHLEQGRLADADGAAGRIEQAIGGGALGGPLAARWQRARAQLTRLRGWAHWGTEQAREQLIAAAQALLLGEPDIDQRARAVPELHKEWKRLDAHGPAAKALWVRFDAAMEKAYRPVREQRASEARKLQAARAAKAARCDTWEAWFTGFSAAPPDLRALAAKRDEIAVQWRAGATAGFRDERLLRKRLDALLKRIDALLDEAQAREIGRRERLVAEAEALREASDAGRAVNEAKTLQAGWKSDPGSVPLRRDIERQLWQRFRAACDAVFARRDAARSEQAAQRDQRTQEREQRARERDARLQAEQQSKAADKAKHAARFERMAEKAAGAVAAGPEALAQGHAARAALLIDLEIALDLPSPEAHANARRARSLVRLQERFRGGRAAPQEPEAMVAQWYAIAATPYAEHATRIAAVVQRLLERTR